MESNDPIFQDVYTEEFNSPVVSLLQLDYDIIASANIAPQVIVNFDIVSNVTHNSIQDNYSCNTDCSTIFARIDAEVISIGGTRITWYLTDGLTDVGPFTAVLQWSPSGHPDNDDWQDCGPPSRDPRYLYDPDQRVWGNWNFLLYRVVLTSESTDEVYTSSPVRIDGRLPTHEALQANEIVRKEKLRMMVTTAGVYGYLLQERRYGTLCYCVDPVTKEQSNSSCPICYGRQYIGGYHPAIPCWFTEPSLEELKKMIDPTRGQTTDSTRMFRMSAEFPIATNDIWVNHYSDERYRIDTVRDLTSMRDLPIILGVVATKLPRTDIAYRIPIQKSTPPDTLAPPQVYSVISY